MTTAEEDYIKAIFQLESEENERINTNQLAGVMHTKPSSVTDMLKRLKAKKMVYYKKYQGANLTAEGKQEALKLVRKHRLWETFLVEKLGFSWKDVHALAEQLEHIESEELIKRLDGYLGQPVYDPHGEPIPDINGMEAPLRANLMTAAQAGREYILKGVVKPKDDLLGFLDKIGFHIGCKFRVIQQEDYSESMEIEMEDNRYFLTYNIANQLLVKDYEQD